MSGPVAVAVRDGVVESRAYGGTGERVDARYAELFPDVPGLFRLIDDAARRQAAWLEVIYDPALGYPSRIVIDYDGQHGNDDEVVYMISAFTAH